MSVIVKVVGTIFSQLNDFALMIQKGFHEIETVDFNLSVCTHKSSIKMQVFTETNIK